MGWFVWWVTNIVAYLLFAGAVLMFGMITTGRIGEPVFPGIFVWVYYSLILISPFLILTSALMAVLWLLRALPWYLFRAVGILLFSLPLIFVDSVQQLSVVGSIQLGLSLFILRQPDCKDS